MTEEGDLEHPSGKLPEERVDDGDLTVAPGSPPPPPQSAEPVRSSHRYLIGETLGEGGMAVVHLATDTELDRQVAVKRLRPQLAVRADARERFFAEARILAGLDHPGIAAVFDAGRLPDGDHYYAMKRVTGRTLRELLDQRTPGELGDRASIAHFVEILIRVCQTMAAAHDRGIIHRDLKPDNIMVDELGVVYVMDWGLAKVLPRGDASTTDSQRTQLGDVMGTPAYMSPEQASGAGATSDCQSDVFSLGVMLYEILTGANPFRGDTVLQSMKGVVFHDPDPPRASNRRVDRALSAIVMKALEKDPFRRYPSARELAEDLRRYREYLPVSAYRPTARERLGAWAHRRPRVATMLGTVVALLVAAGVGTGLQASVENARVAAGYRAIEDLGARLVDLDAEIARLETARGALDVGSERAPITRQLAELEAERDVTAEQRMATALAITGFTILSPDERATEVVRQSLLDSIRRHMADGDLYRARAEIRSILDQFKGRNILGFSEADYERLQGELEAVQREMDAVETSPAAGGAS